MIRKTLIILWMGYGAAIVNSRAFSITEVRFAWSIDANDNPTDIVVSPSAIKSLPIYAAFTVVGTQADIDALEEFGELPITLDWRVNGTVVASPQVGIIPTDWIRDRNALEAEVQGQGFFTWRTFGFISSPIKKQLSIIVRDKTGNIIAPAGSSSGIYEPSVNLNP